MGDLTEFPTYIATDKSRINFLRGTIRGCRGKTIKLEADRLRLEKALALLVSGFESDSFEYETGMDALFPEGWDR